jgi:tRNA G18 (ribose-2'-O)-methylase SpoU
MRGPRLTELVIESVDDPRLDIYRHVRQTNLTRWSGLFIAEGKLVVERLLASDLAVESVLVSDRRRDAVLPALRRDVAVYVVPQSVAEELMGYNFHAGVLACARRPPPVALESVAAKPGRLRCVICPKITGPENLGTLIRLCHGFEVGALVLGPGSADPFSRRVVRVSMGSVFQAPIVESRDLAVDLHRLRATYDIETWAAVASPTAKPLADCARPQRLALVLGNEYEGLADSWLDLCQRHVAIPMAPGADSLNIACAAAILLYHVAHPRR